MPIRWGEEVLKEVPSKFEAVIVSAIECRILNTYYNKIEADPPDKITLLSLDKLLNGEIEYIYYDDEGVYDFQPGELIAQEEEDGIAAPIAAASPQMKHIAEKVAEEIDSEFEEASPESIEALEEQIKNSMEDDYEENEDDFPKMPGNISFTPDEDDE